MLQATMSNPVHAADRARNRCLPRRRFWLCWLIAVAGCSMPASPGDGGGPGKRSQKLVLTPEQELEAGRRAYREVLGEVRDRIVPTERDEVVLARRVTGR